MLKIKDLKKSYDLFQLDVSFEIPRGCITGLIGANGAGKSTIFKGILDLISIDGGTIEIFGKDYKTLSKKEKEKLGVVLAESGFSGFLTVQDVAKILENMYSQFDKAMFFDYCKRYQLPLKKQIKEFSTGMKAKLKILTAISHKAEFLLLDEPTTGLDVLAREDLLSMLREYMEENENRTILISSHISTDLEGLCDDLYMIDNGKVVLHEEIDMLLGQYGLLKISSEQYDTLDKNYLLRKKRESWGYACLTNQKQFYLENYPSYTMEKGSIDEVITMMIKGEKI
ncbi:ABC transporter ATP-binding protein [Blautia hansenii]|uniref:ABC transporter ATP-binding protein n=1 Tax=Blautia hansenii TaxID=1322 RepID=UPI0022E7D5C3|nr:ABC transporter ATP-binding protein [Blautia hansenii]